MIVLKKITLFLLMLLAITSLQAEPLILQPKAPVRYTVTANDTQWDLATKYLQEPWQWPLLWHGKADTLPAIYPGDTLVLNKTNSKIELTVRRTGNTSHRSSAIAPVPLAVIRPFTAQSSVMTSDDFAQLPYVLALDQGQSRADKDDTIFAKGLNNPSLAANYWVLRKKRIYVDPNDVYKTLGVEADYIAMAKVTKLGEPTTLQLTQLDQYVHLGDRLQVPIASQPLQFTLQMPSHPIRAQIIASLVDYAAINRYSVVALNYGAEDGAMPGQILLVSNELSSKKPSGKTIGTLVIFRTFPKVSWALVMQMSEQMLILNGVRSPD
jgi:LysM repeat protein